MGGFVPAGNYAPPVIADLDANGSLEVIASNGSTVNIYNGRDGRALTCQSASCSDTLVLRAGSGLRASPAVADVNLDGKLDVIVGGNHSDSPAGGALYGWTDFGSALGSDPGPLPAGSLAWPLYRGNAQRDGRYR